MAEIIKFIFIAILSSSFWNTEANQMIPDCKIYRKGLFQYESEEGSGLIYNLIREENYQKIFRFNPEHYIKQKITWITDCSYKVYILENNDPERRNSDLALGYYRLIQITENRTESFYEYYYFQENGNKIIGKIYKIKD